MAGKEEFSFPFFKVGGSISAHPRGNSEGHPGRQRSNGRIVRPIPIGVGLHQLPPGHRVIPQIKGSMTLSYQLKDPKGKLSPGLEVVGRISRDGVQPGPCFVPVRMLRHGQHCCERTF